MVMVKQNRSPAGFANYATKSDVKNATGVNTSEYAKKYDLLLIFIVNIFGLFFWKVKKLLQLLMLFKKY